MNYINRVTGKSITARRLTPHNLHELAGMTGGRILGAEHGQQILRLPHHQDALDARPGEWVAQTDTGRWRVYNPWAFAYLYQQALHA